MAKFKYVALANSGERVSGEIDCANEIDAVARIRRSASVILKLEEVSAQNSLLSMEIGSPKLNVKAFTLLCRQFSLILRSGIPLARAVTLIADKTEDKPLKKLLLSVSDDIESGVNLSASFEQHGKKLLPTTFIETIRAGEASGDLSRSFASMQTHFEKELEMKKKIKSAISYPIIILVIASAVIAVLMVAVVPVFTQMFTTSGEEIPPMLGILIGISEFFTSGKILYLLAVAVVIVIARKVYADTEAGGINIAKLHLKLPIVGNVGRLTSASEFANTMSVLMGAGLQIPQAVEITSRIITNKYVAKLTADLVEALEAGRSLHAAMQEQEIMPAILIDMVGVGEETGDMDETLSSIAIFYDDELDQALSKAMSQLKSTLMSLVMVIAGFIVVAMYTSMFSVYGTMG